MIFNSFALVIGALIYPTTTLIVQWYFTKRKKTNNPSCKTENR
jgi:purine-cytosine permease-like protein